MRPPELAASKHAESGASGERGLGWSDGSVFHLPSPRPRSKLELLRTMSDRGTSNGPHRRKSLNETMIVPCSEQPVRMRRGTAGNPSRSSARPSSRANVPRWVATHSVVRFLRRSRCSGILVPCCPSSGVISVWFSRRSQGLKPGRRSPLPAAPSSGRKVLWSVRLASKFCSWTTGTARPPRSFRWSTRGLPRNLRGSCPSRGCPLI